MASRSTIRVVFDHLPALRGTLRKNAAAVVRTTAREIEADAKGRAPVDTGALRASIHTTQVDDLTARVGPGVDYGLYVEVGTHRAAAQPYMGPAAEAARPRFVAAMKKVLD